MKNKRLVILLSLTILLSPVAFASKTKQKEPLVAQSVEEQSFMRWLGSLLN